MPEQRTHQRSEREGQELQQVRTRAEQMEQGSRRTRSEAQELKLPVKPILVRTVAQKVQPESELSSEEY